MGIVIREYQTEDVTAAITIWNQVVEDGVAFPQEENLTEETGDAFFKEQTYTGIAVNTDNNEIVGLYILHPNNVGRCGHICNASYAVRRDLRGEHIGEKLVLDCLAQAKEKGFRVMQFNAVVANNTHALHLYERIGFTRLGVIPQGFRMPDDIMDKYKELVFSSLIFIFFEHSEYKRWKINENSKNSCGDIYNQQSENSLSIHMCSRTENRIYQ